MKQMSRFQLCSFIFFGLSAWIPSCTAYYISFYTPTAFCEPGKESSPSCKSKIDLFTNQLDSVKSLIPYSCSRFDFCAPVNGSESPRENLGQVLLGDRVSPSLYNITFKKDERCKTLCSKTYKPGTPEDMKKLEFLKKGIALDYQNHLIIDNMPVTWCYEDGGREYCSTGFPIGSHVSEDGQTVFNEHEMHYMYVFNHIDIEIKYHDGSGEDWDGSRLMSAKVTPRSINHKIEKDCGNDSPVMEIPLDVKDISEFKIIYSYSVKFVQEQDPNHKWASRWDYILDSMPHIKIQFFSIMNSLVCVQFLSGIVAMTMLTILHKDIARYNQMDSAEDTQEQFGWKLVHGDVFRPPKKGMLLSVMLGCGTQISIIVFFTLVFGCLGFLSPSNRGALMTCALVLFVCLGSPAGYVSARIYKMFGGELWKPNVLLSAFFFPGLMFGIFFLLNLVLWAEGSSAAVPFTTLLALLAMWFGIFVPLTFLGAYLGFKMKPIEQPVRTNQIHRQIPDQSIYNRAGLRIIIAGVLPFFSCTFVPLFFILSSIWFHQICYMFGFLFVMYLILLLTISETTILLCHVHLCEEDYHWWWRSFLAGGSTALHFFIYSIYFFVTKLTITGTASTFLYFGYTLIMVLIFFLFTGTVGFFACFFFVRRIYSTISVPEKPGTT